MARTTDTVVGQILPGGGVTGAILTKASAANGDAVWSLPAVVPAATPIVQGDTLIYQTVNGVLVPLPATQLQFPANPRQMFEVESFLANPDGTLIGTWPDVSGNGLDLTAALAARPTLVTGIDGIRAVQFDGIANVLARAAMVSPNTPEVTAFVVARTLIPATGVHWALGVAGFAPGSTGSIRGFCTVAGGNMGARANNLGGATLRSAGVSTLDGGVSDATGGWYARRALCFKWGDTGAGALERWGQWSLLGNQVSFTDLSAVPVATNFTFGEISLGANGQGGIAAEFALVEHSFFSYYVGADSIAISPRDCWMTLEKLRARYRCL